MTLDKGTTGLKPIDLINVLSENNIEARPVWKPMHMQPVFGKYPYVTDGENGGYSPRFFETGLCLPSGSSLGEQEQARIISLLEKVLKKHGR